MTSTIATPLHLRRKIGGPILWGFVILLTFNVVLPKSGISFGGIDLPTGYALLALFAPLGLIGLIRRPILSHAALFNFLFGYLPIGLFAVLKAALFGASSASSIIYGAILLGFPFMIMICIGPYLERMSEEQIGSIFNACMRAVVAWGIFNFLLYLMIGHIIEIRYITKNAADDASIFLKNNRRGMFMKLVSTYNNGNVYGTCMLMLGPIYIYFEKSRLWIAAFIVSIALTLSRTAWFGMIVMGGAMIAIRQVDIRKFHVWMAAIIGLGVVLTLILALGWGGSDVADTDLGGRAYQWAGLEWSVFGGHEVRISEILYAGLLQSFGVFGFLLAIASLAYPILFVAMHRQHISMLRKAAAAGCFCYMVIAWIDAAFIYPPVMIFYFFLTAMVYRRGYRAGPDATPLRPSSTPHSISSASPKVAA